MTIYIGLNHILDTYLKYLLKTLATQRPPNPPPIVMAV